jgi:hypothetical protein
LFHCEVYGAAIPDDKIDPIADYLTTSYGDAHAK